MKTIEQYFSDRTIRFIDHSKETMIFDEPNRAFISFAIDDAIALTVGDQLAPPTIRMWVHGPTLVMGIPDSRLPYLEEGLQFMRDHQHTVLIRNSGGLAVLLDHGVLNMSLIVPNDGKLGIHDGYDMMYHFIQQLFAPYTEAIKAFEIEGSYCPGDYDLSVDGIKFAGISQRRVRNGVAVQIYLDIEGSSYARASLVRDFYQISKKGIATKYVYPEVNPNVMGTISDLTGHPFTIDTVIAQIRTMLHTNFKLSDAALTQHEEALFHRRLAQMKKRNEKLQ